MNTEQEKMKIITFLIISIMILIVSAYAVIGFFYTKGYRDGLDKAEQIRKEKTNND